jgi:SAM-dependent methyltransferase
MAERDVLEEMRADWNARAREDAHYYVAFGRREQDEEEFFRTAADVVRGLSIELKRLRAPRRALEIGCGPGRLMRPMSRYFEEIHGVDVSDEMVRLAREKLRDVVNARVHANSGGDLALFPDDYLDFVYSYAVFQHIPSREVVFNYLREARRVLRPGGVLRCQINGLPDTARRYTTWEGVRIPAAEIVALAREDRWQLLALEGAGTQYMWVTLRKPAIAPSAVRHQPACIRAIGNATSGEAAVPAEGRFASASVWVEGLPPEADLNTLGVRIDGTPGVITYIGPEELAQVNVSLPKYVRTGMAPLELTFRGQTLAPAAWMRVIPAGPAVPRVVSVSDGVNLLSGIKVTSGSVKLSLEEVADPELLRIAVDGVRVGTIDSFCTEPLARRYEFNFDLPTLAPGCRHVQVTLGKRAFPPIRIEVA